jgi:hypothetical protein
MCEALAMITLRGELDRNRAARFLRDAFNELQPRRRCFIWAGWQSTIAMLGLRELKVLVKRAFDRGFVDPTFRRFADFETICGAAPSNLANRWCRTTMNLSFLATL